MTMNYIFLVAIFLVSLLLISNAVNGAKTKKDLEGITILSSRLLILLSLSSFRNYT